MSKIHIDEERLKSIGCLSIIVAAVIFMIVYLIVNGLSWESVIKAFGIVSLSFWGIVYGIIGLFLVPAITMFYLVLRNELEVDKSNSKWIVPLLNATFFVLLYGLFRILFGDIITNIVESCDFVDDYEKTSRIVLFVVFDILVLIGCLFVRKKPDIKFKDFN